MLRRHIVGILLIAIHPSDGDVKPGSPLGAFRKEQAMSRHRVSPSPFLSSTSIRTTQLHYTNSYTYSHPNFNFLQYTTDTRPTRNVVCPSGAWFENRPHLTPSIHLAWNPKHVMVQWVGIGTHMCKRSVFVEWSVESLPFNPAVWVRFQVGSVRLISILGMGVCRYLHFVQYCPWWWPWHSAEYTFRNARPYVSV